MLRSPTSSWTAGPGFAEVTGTSLKMGGDSGALETKTELGGITVGGEYTMGDMTFGVMGPNFGTGDVEGEGDNDGVKNDVDYYGVQGYAAKRMGQFNLVGQMGLMTTKNDVTSADGDSADIDATIFTIGARSEMAFRSASPVRLFRTSVSTTCASPLTATTPPRASPWMTWTRTS